MDDKELKVGDLVRIKEWYEMEKEFILDSDGDIQIDDCNWFTINMKKFCGEIATITSIIDDYIELNLKESENYDITKDMVVKIPDSIQDAIKSEIRLNSDGITFNVASNNVCEFHEQYEPKNKEKEGKEMELLEIYKRNALEKIEKVKEDEINKTINENDFVKKYLELVNNFEYDLEMLYLSQDVKHTENIIVKSILCKSYSYIIGTAFRTQITTIVSEKYSKFEKELEARLEEVKAQIALIRSTNNDLDSIINVLQSYDIIDCYCKIKEYQLPTELEVCKECRCDKTTKKRGKKPKQNENN